MVGPAIHESGRPYLRFEGAEKKVWLLPVQTTLRHKAVTMYAPYSLKGRIFKSLMYLGLVGSKVHIHEQTLCDLEQCIAQRLGEASVRIAFYNPVSPDRRILLIMKPDGDVVAYARMASKDSAGHVLRHEEYILSLLRDVPTLKPHVPEPLAFFDHEDATVLITSAGPGNKGPSEWTTLHSDFSRKLHDAFKQEKPLSTSKLWCQVTGDVVRYKPHLSETWLARYERALAKLEPYKESVVATSLAHRDFTPWNTQVGPERLFAFDWEYASEDYLPNYDYFHFHFITSTNVSHDVSVEKARTWIKGAPVRASLENSVLFLAYLLDIAAFYQRGVAEADFQESDIAREAGTLIDALDAWFTG